MSRHSTSLDCMINGDMAEAQKRCAVLKTVDEGTIERFIEWAYKGYYTAADFNLETTSRPASPVPSPELDYDIYETILDAIPGPSVDAYPVDGPPPDAPPYQRTFL